MLTNFVKYNRQYATEISDHRQLFFPLQFKDHCVECLVRNLKSSNRRGPPFRGCFFRFP